MVGDRQYDGEHGVPTEKVEKKLEDELGDQMFFHFQQEAAALRSQNEELTRELQKMKDEKELQTKLVVPQTWNVDQRSVTPPPKVAPSTQDSQMWASPETYRCTPNGTSSTAQGGGGSFRIGNL